MGKWSELPTDLLLEVEKHLIAYNDKGRIRFVCKQWYCSLSCLPVLKQIPGMLLPYHERPLCGFYNPVNNEVINLDIQKTGEKLFKGSCHGWVIMIEEDGAIFALNPLTNAIRYLPHRNTFPDVVGYHLDRPGQEYDLSYTHNDTIMDLAHTRYYLTNKVVLSSSPISSDCLVVAIYGQFDELAYCRFGDEKWSSLDETRGQYRDVIFYKEKMYAINRLCELMVCEIGSPPTVTQLTFSEFSAEYLVECSGELIAVYRDIGYPKIKEPGRRISPGQTRDFILYKLDMSNLNWVEVTNLGDHTLFLGFNLSFAVSSRDFPEYKGNCIYFTCDDENSEYYQKDVKFDEGVLDIDTKDVTSLPRYGCDEKDLIWPSAIWFTPNHFDT